MAQHENNVRADGYPFLFEVTERPSPSLGDPWPDTDAELQAHLLARLGLRAPKDIAEMVRRKRDEQAAGFPYYAPTARELADTVKWDRVYRARAERGEITGVPVLDEKVLADRKAARESARAARQATRSPRRDLAPVDGWANVKATMRHWPTAVVFTLVVLYLAASAVVVALQVVGS